jgi:hypothetical protein
MLHSTTQAEYFNWIQTCIKDRSAIGPFCDWLDENDIRSQQWWEVLAFVNKVKYIKLVERLNFIWCSMVTAHKVIDLRFNLGKKTKSFTVSIRNRVNTLTNKRLEQPSSLFPNMNYQKVAYGSEQCVGGG